MTSHQPTMFSFPLWQCIICLCLVKLTQQSYSYISSSPESCFKNFGYRVNTESSKVLTLAEVKGYVSMGILSWQHCLFLLFPVTLNRKDALLGFLQQCREPSLFQTLRSLKTLNMLKIFQLLVTKRRASDEISTVSRSAALVPPKSVCFVLLAEKRFIVVDAGSSERPIEKKHNFHYGINT